MKSLVVELPKPPSKSTSKSCKPSSPQRKYDDDDSSNDDDKMGKKSKKWGLGDSMVQRKILKKSSGLSFKRQKKSAWRTTSKKRQVLAEAVEVQSTQTEYQDAETEFRSTQSEAQTDIIVPIQPQTSSQVVGEDQKGIAKATSSDERPISTLIPKRRRKLIIKELVEDDSIFGTYTNQDEETTKVIKEVE